MIISKLQGGASLLKTRINRCWKSAQRVHDITGENTTKLFIEVVYSWFRYGCSDEDFLTMEFYRKNSREKKRWLTSRKTTDIFIEPFTMIWLVKHLTIKKPLIKLFRSI